MSMLNELFGNGQQIEYKPPTPSPELSLAQKRENILRDKSMTFRQKIKAIKALNGKSA